MATLSDIQQKPLAGTTSAATPEATKPAMPWKSYGQYFAGNPEAQKWGHYQSDLVAGTPEAEHFNAVWGRQTQKNPQNIPNPWQFGQEYNKYKSTLPQTYQDLINYGISPEAVASGQIRGIAGAGGITPIPMAGGGNYGVGSGSHHEITGLDPNILSRMWR